MDIFFSCQISHHSTPLKSTNMKQVLIIAAIMLLLSCSKQGQLEAFKAQHPNAPERVGHQFPEYKWTEPGTVWVLDGNRVVVHIIFANMKNECATAYGVFKKDGTLLSVNYE